ncbi:ankyrin repeat domain-containing protein SOWAHB isoform 2-T2 [Pelodytes ibericus]
MAKDLSQEEVLDFLCQGGGKVLNASLLGHFKSFLRDPQAPAAQLLKHRERFKRYVNSVAVVKQEGAVKYVVLRSRYRDLLGEDLRPPAPPNLSFQDERAEDNQIGSTAVCSQQCPGPQVGDSQSRQPGDWQIQDNEKQPEWTMHTAGTFGHLQQDKREPRTNHSETRELGAVNGKSRDAPSPRTHYSHPSSSDLTPSPPIRSRASRHNSPPPSVAPSPKNSSLNSISASSTTDIPKRPSQLTSGSWSDPPEVQSRTANIAFVSVTCRDLQEQRQGCISCSELNPPNPQLKSRFAHEEHSDYVYKDQPSDSLYLELPASLSHSRYRDSHHPSPSLLLPHESGITPPDVLLADYQPTSASPSPPMLDNDMHGMWMLQMPIFKSIRCQLSLQDLEDFVDQESCGSEGSDSGEGGDCDTEHKDDEEISSDSNNEKYSNYNEHKSESSRCPPNKKFLSIIEQYNKPQSDTLAITDITGEGNMGSRIRHDVGKSPYTAKSFLTDQAPVLFELAVNPPKHRIRSHLQETMSSSDDELIDRDYHKRRRPSRAKKLPNFPVVTTSPDIDRLLTAKPVTSNSFIVNTYLPLDNQKSVETSYVPTAKTNFEFRKVNNFKSYTVPLDPMEHDWIVKSAAGSWLQVYGLFNKDPNLALQKDFVSGYTVLHWFAKYGSLEMFQKFVTGAQKAGIELDMNIKTNCGYTPLHIAAIHGHHKVATMLVEKLKVNVRLRDNSGKRAWQYLSCTTSGEVWQLLGAPRGKTIFPSRALPVIHNLNTHNGSSQLSRKTTMASFLKPQHQKWKANNPSGLRDREIYSD